MHSRHADQPCRLRCLTHCGHALQPRSIDELREVRHTLELYRQNYSAQVAALLVAAYLVLQALSIPGCICINLLMGSMCVPTSPAQMQLCQSSVTGPLDIPPESSCL